MSCLDDLESIARSATPGPWRVPVANVFRVVQSHEPRRDWTPLFESLRIDDDSQQASWDVAYVAALSPDVVLKLLAVARAADALVARSDVPHNGRMHRMPVAGCRKCDALRAIAALEGDA